MAVKRMSYPEQEGKPCAYCGHEMTYRQPAERIAEVNLPNDISGMDARWFPSKDHKLSRHRGGTDDPGNLVFCCSRCNVVKAVMTADEYLAFLTLLGPQADRFLDLLYVSGCGRAGKRKDALNGDD